MADRGSFQRTPSTGFHHQAACSTESFVKEFQLENDTNSLPLLGSDLDRGRNEGGGHTLSVKTTRIRDLLERPDADLVELKNLLWPGVPRDASPRIRAVAWRIMLGCLPVQRERRAFVAEKRRREYLEIVKEYYGLSAEHRLTTVEQSTNTPPDGNEMPPPPAHANRPIASEFTSRSLSMPQRGTATSSSSSTTPAKPTVSSSPSPAPAALTENVDDEASELKSSSEAKLLRQIRLDLPRTNPTGFAIFGSNRIQRVMERALYCWAVRHPASGYVQGINDLITPFILVFLREYYSEDELKEIDAEQIPYDTLTKIEADSYWCLSKVLGFIQDHYTFGQPGIQRLLVKLEDVVRRVDEPLYSHLEAEGLEFIQFAFRWMNCLLLREFPISGIIRLWDTYIAEGAEGFSTFHVYVCAVFLVYWSNQLRRMEFQQMMLFMQKLPTSQWGLKEIETLISEAFVLKSLFHASPKHLV